VCLFEELVQDLGQGGVGVHVELDVLQDCVCKGEGDRLSAEVQQKLGSNEESRARHSNSQDPPPSLAPELSAWSRSRWRLHG